MTFCIFAGSVVVNGLYTDEIASFAYSKPIKAVAIEPSYARSSLRRFAAGGLAGQLVLNSKGWLGRGDNVIHGGEGTIHAILWHG